MSVMPRLRTLLCLVVLGLSTVALAQDDYRDQRLHDGYLGKTFLLRGFYSDDRLRYDASGNLTAGGTSGDWTTDGLVAVEQIHVKGRNLQITARRLDADSLDKMLQLLPAETGKPGKDPKPLLVQIQADLGQENPSLEQAEASLAKIFLTSQDNLLSLVPDYWKPCLAGASEGALTCHFSPELLSVPGFSHSKAANSEADATSGESSEGAPVHVFHPGGGISPPKPVFMLEPEFNDRARQAKFQGVAVLSLVVRPDGTPTNIRIVSPLGSGLDVKAVQAVERWKFQPAQKDGQPVPAAIQVEVSFHLY